MIRMHLIQQPEEISWIRFPANVYQSSKASQKLDTQGIAASLEDKLDIRMNRFEKSLNDMKILSLLLLHLSKQSRKYVLPTDQTIAIISVH
nr:hypothetical protein [Tanacetum cinerariifolium]